MADFKRILFPVDFSEQSSLAAPHVAAFAKYFDAEILLLHTETVVAETYCMQPLAEVAEAQLADFADNCFPDTKVQTFVSTGDPALEIQTYAKRKKADLIMMPTHGRGVFRRFILGSVTAKVLHDSCCPVWTSAHLENYSQKAVSEIRNVVCAVDLDNIGEHTLRYARGLAGRFKAALTVAHAVPAIQAWPESYADLEFQTALIEAARSQLQRMQTEAGTAGVPCVAAGPIAHVVAHAAAGHQADLVVIGRGGHGRLGRLRTNDYAIIRECPCPVLSI